MFLSYVSAYSWDACGSIQVVTKVARFSWAFPSSIASSCTIWYAVSGSISPSGIRKRGMESSPLRANMGLMDSVSLALRSRPTWWMGTWRT